MDIDDHYRHPTVLSSAMAEPPRRTSSRIRLPSLKAELNTRCEAKVAVTRLGIKAKRPQEWKNMTSIINYL